MAGFRPPGQVPSEQVIEMFRLRCGVCTAYPGLEIQPALGCHMRNPFVAGIEPRDRVVGVRLRWQVASSLVQQLEQQRSSDHAHWDQHPEQCCGAEDL